jgi:ribonuclease Z
MVQQVKHKLRAEYTGLTGQKIAALRKEKGDAAVMQEVRENVLAYSGDSPVEYDGRWQDVDTLIHEATFLVPADNDDRAERYNKHSALPDVIAMAATTNIKRLVLGHFSLRYTNEAIISAVQEQCRLHDVPFPVYCILPGMVNRDVLGQPPVYIP